MHFVYDVYKLTVWKCLSPVCSNDINNCGVLASPETSDDCDEVTDGLMESSPCRDERKLPASNSVSLKSLSKTVSGQKKFYRTPLQPMVYSYILLFFKNFIK